MISEVHVRFISFILTTSMWGGLCWETASGLKSPSDFTRSLKLDGPCLVQVLTIDLLTVTAPHYLCHTNVNIRAIVFSSSENLLAMVFMRVQLYWGERGVDEIGGRGVQLWESAPCWASSYYAIRKGIQPSLEGQWKPEEQNRQDTKRSVVGAFRAFVCLF